MAGFAKMGTMDIWYAHLSEEEIMAAIATMVGEPRKARRRRKRRSVREGAKKIAAKARTRDSLQALSKLAEHVDGNYRIVSPTADRDPRARARGLLGLSADEVQHALHEQFRAYRATLQDDRRHLLERFQVVDVARKVVGVGSVGTRAFIVLLQGRDQEDPLFLQVKEATSVGAGGSPAEEPLQAARRTRGAGATDDAGRERHLPRLDQGRGGEPVALLASAPRHEGLRSTWRR